MDTILHKAQDRGSADHDWLNAHHSFSFANYHNPDRMGFGVLRVLNDDIISPGYGFDEHPHRNMEIITIPLSGILTHKDSLGHEETLGKNEVQVMSAGSGVLHSEKNLGKNPLSLLQLWITPKENNIAPQYAQKKFSPLSRKNMWECIVSPKYNPKSDLVSAQDSYISWGEFETPTTEYTLHNSKNGVFLFVIHGVVCIEKEVLTDRDALAISTTDSCAISLTKPSFLLAIEVPLG